MSLPENLNALFLIAETTAKQSPCLRRKYGAVVGYSGPEIRYVTASNSRMNERCCAGSICIRDRVKVSNGERTEVGAEIHAEVAALIQAGPKEPDSFFILTGFDVKGKPLYGKNAYPCHACALALKFAGYKYIYMRESAHRITAYSVAQILEERQAEWIVEI